MPFTPLHMGPGIVIKALLQCSFSLMVFGWAQIVMDIQPLLVMLSGHGSLHGISHTYAGAVVLGVFAAWSGKYLSEYGLKLLGLSRAENPVTITWRVAALSAGIGTISHVLLDSIMHGDVEPWYPISAANGLYGLASIETLYRFCLYSAVAGTLLYFLVQYLMRRHATG